MAEEAQIEGGTDDASAAAAPAVGKGRSKKSQELSWQKIRLQIEKFRKTRPNDHISSFLSDLREVDISRKDPTAFYRQRDLVRPMGQKILAAAGRDIEDHFYFPDVRAGRYTTAALSSIRYLLSCIRKDTRAVVELGSGWSSNLFQIYVGHGATRSKNIHYHGAEYTIEGQHSAKLLAGHDEKIHYYAHSFDYRKPKIDFLRKYPGHILVFTRHSIEQVDLIDPRLYADLCSLKAQVTLVHLEPVGWQRSPELVALRAANAVDYFTKIGETIHEDVDSPERQMANAAWWSWRLAYNVNLKSIVDEYCAKGKARMIRQEYDFAGIGNILNPTTLFHLELW